MAVSQKKIRVMLRWMHIVSGLIILCYIYSPFHEIFIFQIAVKFLIIPIITLSGIWIWKFMAINKFLKIPQ